MPRYLYDDLSKESLAGIKAHNAHRPEPSYNDNWNTANQTGTMRARYLCVAALTFKYGICAGSMKHRKATKQILSDYLLYSSKPELCDWACCKEVSA